LGSGLAGGAIQSITATGAISAGGSLRTNCNGPAMHSNTTRVGEVMALVLW